MLDGALFKRTLPATSDNPLSALPFLGATHCDISQHIVVGFRVLLVEGFQVLSGSPGQFLGLSFRHVRPALPGDRFNRIVPTTALRLEGNSLAYFERIQFIGKIELTVQRKLFTLACSCVTEAIQANRAKVTLDISTPTANADAGLRYLHRRLLAFLHLIPAQLGSTDIVISWDIGGE